MDFDQCHNVNLLNVEKAEQFLMNLIVLLKLQGTGLHQVITTNDPRLTALGLPQYPPLPGSTDPSKIEEIRRTVYVSNLEPVVRKRDLCTLCISLHGKHMELTA